MLRQPLRRRAVGRGAVAGNGKEGALEREIGVRTKETYDS